MDIRKVDYTGRRTGNTTRLVDAYIQELFALGQIEVFEYYWDDDQWKDAREGRNDRRVAEIIMSRLEREHFRESMKDQVKWDRDRNIITLLRN